MSQSSHSPNDPLLIKEISLIMSKNLAAAYGDNARAEMYAAQVAQLQQEISFRASQSIAKMAELTADPAMKNPQTYADYTKTIDFAVDLAFPDTTVVVMTKCTHGSRQNLSAVAWKCLLCGVEGGLVVSPDGQGYEYEEKVAGSGKKFWTDARGTKPKPPLGKIRELAVEEDLDPPRSLRFVS